VKRERLPTKPDPKRFRGGDINLEGKQTKRSRPLPCHFGDGCSRSDCYFRHPGGKNRHGLKNHSKLDNKKHSKTPVPSDAKTTIMGSAATTGCPTAPDPRRFIHVREEDMKRCSNDSEVRNPFPPTSKFHPMWEEIKRLAASEKTQACIATSAERSKQG